MAKFRGSHPAPTEGYELTAVLDGFSVYITKIGPTGWRRIKLAANGKRDRKANYLLAWNGHRFAGTRDLDIMQEHLPELFDRLLILAQGDFQ